MDIEQIVRRALDEDLPDVTSESIFDSAERGHARFVVKEAGIIAGLAFAEATFKAIEADATFERRAADGDAVEAGAACRRRSWSRCATWRSWTKRSPCGPTSSSSTT